MIGEKKLEMPETMMEVYNTINGFGLKMAAGNEQLDGYIVHNARRLVELNNEVYDKLHSCEFCKSRYPGIEKSDYCRMCGKEGNRQ